LKTDFAILFQNRTVKLFSYALKMLNRIKINRSFRKIFARTLQLLVHKDSSNQHFTGQLNSVVILAQEKIGDSILLTPLLRNLRYHFPALEIYIICFNKVSADFFRHDSHITAIYLAKHSIIKYYRHVLSKKFDLLFNTKDSPSTNFLLQTVLIRARFKVGHQNSYHEGLFNHLLEIKYHTRMVMKNCSLLSLLSVYITEKECRPYLPPAPVSEAISLFLEKMEKGKLIGINISAGGKLRYWPEVKWSALIVSFPNQQFIIFSAPAEKEMKLRLEMMHHNVTVSPPTSNIYEAGLLVKQLRLLVTPDTALIHVASCYSIPAIGLYTHAPQDLSRFAPFLIDCELVVSSTSQVSDIDVASVAAALQKQLLK